MPEGDSVYRAARKLNTALADHNLIATDFRLPKLAAADLTGQQIKEAVSRGKHILIRTTEGTSVRSHLKMEGEWNLYRPGEKWRGGPAHWIRVVLQTEPWTAVGYRLAMVEIVPTAEEEKLVGHLGPDLLGPGWDIEEALRRIMRDPGLSIAEALLEQTNLAGIGNFFKNEVLFLKGIWPWTATGEVEDLRGVVELAQRLLKFSAEHGPEVTTGDLRKGRKSWVMERPGNPCFRCGTLIEVTRGGSGGVAAPYGSDSERQKLRSPRDNQGGPPERLTYWCPHCQPAPKAAVLLSGRAAGPRPADAK